MGVCCKVLRVEPEKLFKRCLTFMHTPAGVCLDAQFVLVSKSSGSHFLVTYSICFPFPDTADLLCSLFWRLDFFSLSFDRVP